MIGYSGFRDGRQGNRLKYNKDPDADQDTTMKGKDGGRAMPFSLHETARLFVMLRDTGAREALRKTRRQLNAAELDAGVTRFAPWSETIARIFNNREYKPNVKFYAEESLLDVNASKCPPVMRTGPALRSEFTKLRPKFTLSYANFSKSGHNEVDNFVDYVEDSGGRLSRVSLQLLIIFEVCRCGTQSEDSDLRDMILKNLDNVEVNGYEGGLDDCSANTPCQVAQSQRVAFPEGPSWTA